MTEGARRPLRALAEVSLGRQRSPAHESGDFMVRYLRAANVKDGRLDLSDVKEMNFTPSEQVIYSLRPGDVLISEGAGSLAAVGTSTVWKGEIEGTVCFQNTLLRARPRPGVNPRFLAWWCRHAYASGIFASVAGGVNIFHLGAERVRAVPATMPPPDLQTQVADFLDAETVRIDALIAKKRRLIDLLSERWQIASFQMITGQNGSDAVPVTAWFGAAPQHWKISTLKSLTSFVNGCAFEPDEWGDEGLPIIRIENLNGGGNFNLTVRDVDRRYRVTQGDLLFGWSGNRGTSFGPFRWERPGTYLLNQHIFRLPAESVDHDWLYWVLKAATPYVEELAHGIIGMVHITKDRLGGIPVPVPPMWEQRELARNLNALARAHDALRAHLDRQLALLMEHRQALITAAVTGELKVA